MKLCAFMHIGLLPFNAGTGGNSGLAVICLTGWEYLGSNLMVHSCIE